MDTWVSLLNTVALDTLQNECLILPFVISKKGFVGFTVLLIFTSKTKVDINYLIQSFISSHHMEMMEENRMILN